MSPERQAVLNAIAEGHTSVAAIAKAVNKPNQTISKLLYKLKKLGIVTVDSNGDISTKQATNVDISAVNQVMPLSTNVANLGDISTVTQILEQNKKLTNLLAESQAQNSQLALILERLDKPTNVEANTIRFEALETQNAQLKDNLFTVQKKLSEASNEIDLKRQHIETLETEKNELKQQFDRLQSNSERQQSDLKETLDKVDKLETELKVALSNVDSLAADNEALRSSLEPVKSTEPKSDRFTVEQGHDRFIELRDQYPEKRQTELARILDSEGYKSSKDKPFSTSVISRWFHEVV